MPSKTGEAFSKEEEAQLDGSEFKDFSDIAEHAYFWIFTVFGGSAVLIWRLVKSNRSYASLTDYVYKAFGSGEELLAKVVKQMSCVVVDDKPEDFPLDFLKGFFFSVSAETKVSLNDAKRLSHFDVIFLDVAGVVMEDAERGGAILIRDIRNFRRRGIIVSVSSKKYDVEVTNYFSIADIRLRKPIQATAVQQQIVAHLRGEAGPEALAKSIDAKFATRLSGRGRQRLINYLGRPASNPLNDTLPKEVTDAGIADELRELRRLLSSLSM